MFVVAFTLVCLIPLAQVLALMVPSSFSAKNISDDRALILYYLVNFFGSKGMKVVIS